MSKIKRSTFQKIVEENKRLKSDIKILVQNRHEPLTKEQISIISKWRLHFYKVQEFNTTMKRIATQYIKDHVNELPDFLTNKTI